MPAPSRRRPPSPEYRHRRSCSSGRYSRTSGSSYASATGSRESTPLSCSYKSSLRPSSPSSDTDSSPFSPNTAFPFFVNVNSTNASVKIYKVAPGGENFYTYWLGVDKNTSNSNNYCFTAHTMSQIVREDRNKSTDAKYKNCNKKEYDFRSDLHLKKARIWNFLLPIRKYLLFIYKLTLKKTKDENC